ncbi:MAG: phosphotransferase [Pseudomonadales bacterium]|nr:phosphotransferase [Pseudomonadales bacterium]MCP5184126.1 phosphotransferase [Pseudomonadales bacterium]
MPDGTPTAEINVTTEIVRTLLAQQAPEFAQMPLAIAANGWDNTLVAVGDRWLARLPRRALAAPLIRHEQQLLSFLAPRLPVPVPVPIRSGVPGTTYPWHWSLVERLPGEPATRAALNDNGVLQWADFLAHLHRPQDARTDPPAPLNPYRGVPLTERSASVHERLAQLQQLDHPVSGTLLDVWRRAQAAPVATVATWLHGDPHPGNILTRDSALSAVVDWGDVTAGDPAGDLGSLWLLADDLSARERALALYRESARYPLTTAGWQHLVSRARGWAFAYGVMLLGAGLVDNPEHAAVGRRALANLTADPGL